MSYSVIKVVRQVLVGVGNSPATDYDMTPQQLSDAQVGFDIADADSQIDAALGSRYTVPFVDPIPPLVVNLSINIAAYLCDLRFRGAREYASDLSPFYLRYQRALDILKQLSEGTIVIPDPEGDDDDSALEGHSEVFNPYIGSPLFTTKQIFTRWPEGVIRDD